MKITHRLLVAVIFSFLILIPPAFIEPAYAADIQIETSSKGFFVRTYQNRDFPSDNGLSSKQIKSEIARMVSFAKQCGYTTIYYEAVPSADAMYQSKAYPTSGFWLNNQGDFSIFDPMMTLMDEAKKADISVYAVINPYRVGTGTTKLDNKNLAAKNPDLAIPIGDNIFLNPSADEVINTVLSSANELVKKYGVSGIALEGLDADIIIDDTSYLEAVNKLVEKMSDNINDISPSTKLGVIFNADNRELYPNIRSWSEGAVVDFIVPIINHTTDSNSRTYKAVLENIKLLILNSNTKLFTGNSANRLLGVSSDNENFIDPNEINYQLFTNFQSNVDGFVIDSYDTLIRNLDGVSENIVSMFSTGATLYSDTVLTIPNTFAVTRPNAPITTAYSTYFITGTSVPGLPVYVDGSMITSEPTTGVFGTLVSLKDGENTFTVTHNGKSIPVKITKKVKASAIPSPITTISQASTQPQVSYAAKPLEEIILSCVAPAGGTVSVNVNGLSVKLQPASTTEKAGLPIKYTGTIKLSDNHPATKTTSIGKATYTLTYNGKITTAKSPANIYVVGNDAKLSVSVSDYIAGVYKDPAKEGDFLTTFKNGSTDYAIEQTSTHYKLQSGGYIKKSAVEVNEGAVQIDNHVSSVNHTTSNENEAFIISGTSKVPFNSRIDKNSVVITLFNTYDLPDISVENSNLFSSVSTVEINESTHAIRFVLKDNESFWGYNVEYSDNDTIIYFKIKPPLSPTYGKPLENVSVLLDPGHGGKDPGAIGVAGVDAPMEAQINLAVAKATKHRLEQLGATVQMTRYDNTFVALADRLRISEQMKPDFFISMHHNSTAESSDSNKTRGVEVYYHDTRAENLAKLLERDISQYNKRLNRGYFQGYYYVTRMTYAPAVLIELGFLPSPFDYADITNQLSMYKTSCAVSNAIMDCLS